MVKQKDKYLYKIEEEFNYKGFKCVVLLINLPKEETQFLNKSKYGKLINTKWRCGYVGVNKKHIFYKKDYMDLANKNYNFGIHGDLTFSGFRNEILPKGYWYFGFDCNHSNDKTSYWNFKRVKSQVKKLARALQRDELILLNLKDKK